jgi:rod shape determining protein RodA
MTTLTPAPGGLMSSRRSRSDLDWLRHLDYLLLGSVAAISGLGLLMIYAATKDRGLAAGTGTAFLTKQAEYIFIGVVAMAITIAFDYRKLRDLSKLAYASIVLALLLVISPLGTKSLGAQAWFQVAGYQFQPSEFGKIVIIVALAAYVTRHRAELDLAHLGIALAIAGVPILLILKQPDLGTSMVLVFAVLAVLAIAGIRTWHLAVLILLGITMGVVVFQFGLLDHYQVDRLTVFLNPNKSLSGAGYNVDQSKTTIAHGGLVGKGLFKGTQTNLGYVPEQQTDFIFTVVGEELGFVGGSLLLALFALMIWRTWRTARLAGDHFGTLICIGVLAMFMFQIFENIGMTMGIMPVTGIPLPFMSYGGSSTITYFVCIGLVANVHMRRFS